MMPDWAKDLFVYGPLGLFAYWVFAIAIPRVYRDLFDRDPKSPGMMTQKWNIAIERERRQIAFIDALEKRDEVRDEQTAEQQEMLGRLATNLEVHHERSSETRNGVASLKLAAMRGTQACREFVRREFPNSSDQIDRCCDEIERIIGQA